MTPPDQLAKVEVATEMAIVNDWFSRLNGFVIQSDSDEANIVGVIQEVHIKKKALEDKRTTFTKPLHELKTNIDALFRTPRLRLEEIERLCKGMITTYMAAKQARNQQALQAAAAAPTPVVAQQVLAQVRPVEAPQNVSVRHVWQFQITQPELVPVQFLSPDPAKIQAYLAQTSTPSIPGVVFSQKAITTVRQGR